MPAFFYGNVSSAILTVKRAFAIIFNFISPSYSCQISVIISIVLGHE